MERKKSVVTPERFASGMTFDQYVADVGTAENLKREGATMAESELYRKGKEIRRQLLGDYADRLDTTTYADPIMRKFRETVTETVFGALWARPGLDVKTRTLVCVVSDAATGRDAELAIHLRMARRQGWTEEELTEVLLHMSGYVGVPIIRESLLTASRVFAEMRGSA